ncbi:hypothetical protein T07_78 [Trichinella nelsoni]|uniref:Uncharacterized protein n=1 Tax=Trichinella nelsoni TaxID=6336 RepID=A0A0V0RYN7_9BILA|nr:hypothetical protein T07_78 [Trichinella nelsoni]
MNIKDEKMAHLAIAVKFNEWSKENLRRHEAEQERKKRIWTKGSLWDPNSVGLGLGYFVRVKLGKTSSLEGLEI